VGFYIPEDGILHSHRRESLSLLENGMWLRSDSLVTEVWWVVM
jgi:hypothetical protein